ncbi:hypothetical protein X975_26483, partial [Stegodyphus mimosarum]
MKESLAIERGECAERIDRRLFRERRELEQQQESCVRALQNEMKAWLHKGQNGVPTNGDHQKSNVRNGIYHAHNGNIPLMRSKSEDLLSETNSNHNSVSLLSSTITGVSRFTNNSNCNRTYLNPAQCGTKPKVNSHMPNVSRLKMRCLGYPELKRESRSEGDLTSCHTETTDYNTNRPALQANAYSIRSPCIGSGDKHTKVQTNFHSDYTAPQLSRDKWNGKEEVSGLLWRSDHRAQKSLGIRNDQQDNISGFQSDASKSQTNYVTVRPSYCTNINPDQNRHLATDILKADLKTQTRTHPNGLPSVQSRDITSSYKNHASIAEDRSNNVLSAPLENDGSSFV